MKFKHYSILFLVSITLLVFTEYCWAAKPYDTAEEERYWSIFLRTKKDTPAEELEYARELEKKGSEWFARRHYKALTKHWPTSPQAPVAQLALARLLDESDKEKDAFEAYQKLFDSYPGRFPSEEVLNRQFELAVEIMNSRVLRFLFGGLSDPEEAIPLFENIIENAPEWEKAPNAQYLIGKAYQESGKPELAIPAYQAVELNYPDTPLAEKSAFEKCKLLYELSARYDNDSQIRQKALSALNLFISQYPESDYREEALKLKNKQYERCAKSAYDVAHFYDTVDNRPEAALIEYRRLAKRFPNSKWTAKAKKRIVELQEIVEEKDESN